MTIDTSSKMGETPIFSTKAHVFHIDPQTKRSWISASSAAVNVNFYYDMARNLYRIISVEGQKAVINSIITPNMTFTKTSQKFGQWSDIRANTVYGLGFSSEPELNKFIEKFQEVKEATRSTQSKSNTLQHNGGGGGGGQHHHQLHQQQHLSGSSSVMSARDSPRLSSEMANDILLTGSLLPHQRSQSLSGLQATKHLTESPKYGGSGGGGGGGNSKEHSVKQQHVSSILLPQSSTEAQLRYENDRLKLALAQSSTNAKKWEIELQTLKSNNTRLTNALQESTANVEEWKRQLQALKDENTKMKHKIVELEAIQGNPEAIAELRKEIAHMRANCETLESDLKHRDGEVERLRKRLDEQCQAFGSSTAKVDDKIKALLNDNEGLRLQLSRLSGGDTGGDGDHSHLLLNNNNNFGDLQSSSTSRSIFEQLNHRFAQNIADLRSLHAEYQEYSTLLNA